MNGTISARGLEKGSEFVFEIPFVVEKKHDTPVTTLRTMQAGLPGSQRNSPVTALRTLAGSQRNSPVSSLRTLGGGSQRNSPVSSLRTVPNAHRNGDNKEQDQEKLQNATASQFSGTQYSPNPQMATECFSPSTSMDSISQADATKEFIKRSLKGVYVLCLSYSSVLPSLGCLVLASTSRVPHSIERSAIAFS